MEERLTAAGGELAAEVRAGVATVTLNRPSALNALTSGMLQGLAAWLDAWEDDDEVHTVVLRGAGDKAFCAGGDVRALYEQYRTGDRSQPGDTGIRPLLDFFVVEYALDYHIHTYPKPIVAVLDGIVMGGGMGLAQGASLRIVGERTKMAMPETAIGLFPDVGGSFFLSRAPGRLGVYLGLIGPTLRAADALYCGLADLYIGAGTPPAPELEALRPAIDRHFAHDSVEAIAASLESEQGTELREWAARTRDALARRSPTMLAVALEQLRRGATMSLADCFRMELGLIHACFEQGDFIEGIRALIVDKDNSPRWQPRSSIEPFFQPRWAPEDHPLAALG